MFRIHEAFKAQGGKLVDGYAPFCKHIFVPNFVGAKLGALEITDTNRHLVRSGGCIKLQVVEHMHASKRR